MAILYSNNFETNLGTMTTYGDQLWTRVANPIGSGFVAKSGQITHSQISRLQLVYDSPSSAKISFDYLTRSESGWDVLIFYIDGIEQSRYSGDGSSTFTSATFNIISGQRTFVWEYSKDSSDSVSTDTSYIDNVVIETGGGNSGNFLLMF